MNSLFGGSSLGSGRIHSKESPESRDHLIAEAWNARRSGWDFSWLDGRVRSSEPPWDYRARAVALTGAARRLLDIDTGGGEFLAGLAPLPAGTQAVESWAPNVEVARERLEPLGVKVHESLDACAPGIFDLALNRHGRLEAQALAGVMAPGGVLLTQQVGSRNHLELNEALEAPAPRPADEWTLEAAAGGLEAAGFRILDAREALLPYRFLDIGAVVYQLRAIPWQVEGFEPEAYADRLHRIDARILADGGFTAHDHRFLIEAEKI
jgi:hypothetical protein